ncbi:MAG: CBS domain-containing protein [Anaerolineaceae bacterium]|jgi:CBS domain-containing protein|nr:CBS domain-containing protein [Anaerolineaceae bacterium]
MNLIRHLLSVKGHDTWLVRPDAMVIDALRLMKEKDVAALLVMEHSQLVGIITEQDYARRGEIAGRLARTTPVKEMMTPAPIHLHPDQTVQEAVQIMGDEHIGHLPVVENGEVIGLISAGDLLRDIVFQQKRTIQDLEACVLVNTARGQERLKGSNQPRRSGFPVGN